jgi:hypothetical protein
MHREARGVPRRRRRRSPPVADDDVRLPLVTEDEDGTGAFAIACGSLRDPSRAILLLGIGQQQRLPHAGSKQTGPSGIEGREGFFLDRGHHCGLAGNGHNVTSDLSGASDRNHRQKVPRPPRKREQDAQRRRPFPCSATCRHTRACGKGGRLSLHIPPESVHARLGQHVLPKRQLGS